MTAVSYFYSFFFSSSSFHSVLHLLSDVLPALVRDLAEYHLYRWQV